MAEKLIKGLFITFEGGEGSGKSTHSKRLAQELLSEGYEVVYTKEPGGTPLGERVRELLLEKDDINLSGKAELLLFEADRAQHVEECILPAIKEKRIVICDRFNMATFAYQGHGLGMDMELITELDRTATGGLEPDLTVLMDIDIKTGLRRATAGVGADRMEKRDTSFHERVRAGYLGIAREKQEQVKIISADKDIESTYAEVKRVIYDFIEGYKGTD